MIIFVFIILLIILIIAHFLYEIFNDLFIINDDYTEKYKQYQEGFYGDRPFRDSRNGSYIDPENKNGNLGNEKTSKTIENIQKIKKMINNVFGASSKLDDSINPNEQRTGDQVFIFHDELEGVKNTNNPKYKGRIWSTTDFLSRLEKDGYSYNIKCKDDYWTNRIIFPDEK